MNKITNSRCSIKSKCSVVIIDMNIMIYLVPLFQLMVLFYSLKNSFNVAIETHSLSLNPKDVQPNPYGACGLPSRMLAWYPQSEPTSAMLCLLEILRYLNAKTMPIQIPADHPPQGCSRSPCDPKKYALTVSKFPILFSLAHLVISMATHTITSAK